MTTPNDYWRPGDDSGSRRFVTFRGADDAGFTFEGGGHLDEVTVAYETWGTLNADRSNAVLVEHALTGDAHAAGEAGPGQPTPGWWNGLIGPGLGIDTDQWFVVCSNVLGGAQGTTGPSSLDRDGRAYGSRFPVITVRDQVDVEAELANHLRIATWRAVIGGSMGGMRSLEWTVGYPERVARSVVLAVGAASTSDEIAHSALQVRVIKSIRPFTAATTTTPARRRSPASLSRGAWDRSPIARVMSSTRDLAAPRRTTVMSWATTSTPLSPISATTGRSWLDALTPIVMLS